MSDKPRGTWLASLPQRFPVRVNGGVPVEPRLHQVRRPVGWAYRPLCQCAFCIAETAGRVLDGLRRAA